MPDKPNPGAMRIDVPVTRKLRERMVQDRAIHFLKELEFVPPSERPDWACLYWNNLFDSYFNAMEAERDRLTGIISDNVNRLISTSVPAPIRIERGE